MFCDVWTLKTIYNMYKNINNIWFFTWKQRMCGMHKMMFWYHCLVCMLWGVCLHAFLSYSRSIWRHSWKWDITSCGHHPLKKINKYMMIVHEEVCAESLLLRSIILPDQYTSWCSDRMLSDNEPSFFLNVVHLSHLQNLNIKLSMAKSYMNSLDVHTPTSI